MTTPIVDFVQKYAKNETVRLHMPGHKGKGFLGVEGLDITEIDGADVLYSADGIIKQSENIATEIFGTKATFYSTEGSSLAIRAMLYLTKLCAKAQGVKPLILAGRNAHKTFLTAAALLDLEVEWLLPNDTESVIACNISAKFLEEYLRRLKQKPIALYITSPDYLGNTVDIAAISKICKKNKILLLVDNAHGAYLRFLKNPQHPIIIGADMCCDSAHKTLPVLTGGAYLHIATDAPAFLAQNAEQALSVFASTSPSYLILQSLDKANEYLKDGYDQKLNSFATKMVDFKNHLLQNGYTIIGNEPLKLTLDAKAYGYTGCELAEKLKELNIVCEFSDPDYLVMMFTPEMSDLQIERLKQALLSIDKKQPIEKTVLKLGLKKQRLSLNEAVNLPSVELDPNECDGRIAAAPTVICPPAIPIVVCGEEIDKDVINAFNYYGISKCSVIDERYL